MRPSPKSLTRRPINSAAEPHGRTAAGSLDQNNSVATNGPEIGARATASAPDSTSQVSNRLAVLAELSVADLRLEWRRLFRADPPRLSRDIMMRAVAYRLQESAHGGASKVTQRRLNHIEADLGQRNKPPRRDRAFFATSLTVTCPASRSSVALWPSWPLATSSTLGLSVSARTGDHDPQASPLRPHQCHASTRNSGKLGDE